MGLPRGPGPWRILRALLTRRWACGMVHSPDAFGGESPDHRAIRSLRRSPVAPVHEGQASRSGGKRVFRRVAASPAPPRNRASRSRARDHRRIRPRWHAARTSSPDRTCPARVLSSANGLPARSTPFAVGSGRAARSLSAAGCSASGRPISRAQGRDFPPDLRGQLLVIMGHRFPRQYRLQARRQFRHLVRAQGGGDTLEAVGQEASFLDPSCGEHSSTCAMSPAWDFANMRSRSRYFPIWPSTLASPHAASRPGISARRGTHMDLSTAGSPRGASRQGVPRLTATISTRWHKGCRDPPAWR